MQALQNIDVTNKTVLIRSDLNVPLQNGEISNDQRIKASLPTYQLAIEQGAKQVIIMSHLGRPTEGEFDKTFSLAPIAQYLTNLLNEPVALLTSLDQPVPTDARYILLENVRFNEGEKKDSLVLSEKYAALCDIFVMDAFGTAHRAQASTHGVINIINKTDTKLACAGPLLQAELDAFDQAMTMPKSPVVAIVGGAKVSTKLPVLTQLANKVDQLVVGGGIANTFLKAAGYNVGASLYEEDLVSEAKAIMEQVHIPLPSDVVVATEFSEQAKATIKPISEVQSNEMILDVGPDTAEQLAAIMSNAGTIVWNGPVGVFEWEAFSQGTHSIAKSIAKSDAFSVAGGGDTLAAVDIFEVKDQLSYVSTGGGAFLELLEGKELPSVTALKQS